MDRKVSFALKAVTKSTEFIRIYDELRVLFRMWENGEFVNSITDDDVQPQAGVTKADLTSLMYFIGEQIKFMNNEAPATDNYIATLDKIRSEL